MKLKIAIIGAGISGLTLANDLLSAHDIKVFEKSRGPGGRLASKRVATDDSKESVDMGAQYFTCRGSAFATFLDQHIRPNKAVSAWHCNLKQEISGGQWRSFEAETRYVGYPRMSALTRQLAMDIDILTNSRITAISGTPGKWWLTDENNALHGYFDCVLITTPAEQLMDLLQASKLENLVDYFDVAMHKMQPCWAIALNFDTSIGSAWTGMEPCHSAIAWMANDSSKPGRQHMGEWWTIHSTPQWAQQHVDAPADWVVEQLSQYFRDLTLCELPVQRHLVHRWRYARPQCNSPQTRIWHPQFKIGIAGDWLSGGRVEGAFDSARRLMNAIISV